MWWIAVGSSGGATDLATNDLADYADQSVAENTDAPRSSVGAEEMVKMGEKMMKVEVSKFQRKWLASPPLMTVLLSLNGSLFRPDRDGPHKYRRVIWVSLNWSWSTFSFRSLLFPKQMFILNWLWRLVSLSKTLITLGKETEKKKKTFHVKVCLLNKFQCQIQGNQPLVFRFIFQIPRKLASCCNFFLSRRSQNAKHFANIWKVRAAVPTSACWLILFGSAALMNTISLLFFFVMAPLNTAIWSLRPEQSGPYKPGMNLITLKAGKQLKL